MHTLPIKPRLLFLSKLISGIVGIICTIFVISISDTIFHTFIAGFYALKHPTYVVFPFNFLEFMFETVFDSPFKRITFTLMFLICSQLLGYAAISINNMFFKNNKILNISIIGFILLFIEHIPLIIIFFDGGFAPNSISRILILNYIIFSCAYALISCKTLKKHLNLS